MQLVHRTIYAPQVFLAALMLHRIDGTPGRDPGHRAVCRRGYSGRDRKGMSRFSDTGHLCLAR